MTFRFVHASDLHLDTPFFGLRRFDERLGEALSEATLEAFRRIGALATSKDASALVIAGDLYDGPSRGLRAQRVLRDGLEGLGDQGIPSFVVQGNHDPLASGYSVVGGLSPSVTVFPPRASKRIRVEAKDGTPLEFQGVSYLNRAELEDLSRFFEAPDPTCFSVGLLHCSVGVYRGHDTYSPTSIESLSQLGFDYLALGHIHRFEVLRDHHPTIVYSGNSQGLSLKPTELGPKGAVVVEVGDDRVVRVERVDLSPVVFDEYRVRFDESISGDELRIRLRDEIANYPLPSHANAAVLRVYLEMPELGGDLRSSIAVITQDINDDLWGGGGAIFLESVVFSALVERGTSSEPLGHEVQVFLDTLVELAQHSAPVDELSDLGSLALPPQLMSDSEWTRDIPTKPERIDQALRSIRDDLVGDDEP